MIACGHVPSLSYSQATGRISLVAKSCASSRSAFCSSVTVKSTTAALLSGRLTGQSIDVEPESTAPGDACVNLGDHGAYGLADERPGDDRDTAGDGQRGDERQAPLLGKQHR